MENFVNREHFLSIVLGAGLRVVRGRVEYGDAKGNVLLEAHLNNLPQRQKFSGAT
jgi:hypothetical protein